MTGPASLYILTVAKSGERKTFCDNLFSGAVRNWERESTEAGKPLKENFAAQMKAWETAEQGYKERIKKEARDGRPIEEIDNLLAHHESVKPKEPRIPAMLRMDDTPEALGLALTRWPIAAVLSSEAGIIFGAHGMNQDSVTRNMAQFNVFWDGGRLKRDRTTTHSIDIEGMRVTVGLQVQPEVLENFNEKTGGLARHIGFLARFLFSYPESTQGERFFKDIKHGQPALTAFHSRVGHLLGVRANVNDDGKLVTTYLDFDQDARQAWIEFHDEIEEQLGEGARLFDVQDVAAKAAENAARLAANFEMFDSSLNGHVLISNRSMNAASEVMRWHLKEALRYCQMVSVPEVARDAEVVEKWIIDYCRAGSFSTVSNRASHLP